MEESGTRNRRVGRAILAGAVAVALAGVVALSAQARGPAWSGRGPSPEKAAARMAERLGLSAEQKGQVQEILTKGQAKRLEIWEEGRRKMESLRQDTDKRLAGVLTAEQMEKLRAFREERREHRRDRGPWRERPDDRAPGGPPPERN